MKTTRIRVSGLSSGSIGLVLAVASATGQELPDETDAADGATPPTEVVVVTGSRIAREEIDGPSPVTILSQQDIETQGFTTVYEALNTLTQNSGNTAGETSTNSFTPNAGVVDLRGLGPGRTLVLINGRRAADYPAPYNAQTNFVSLASIPAAIVERVEVLAGGASAIYGSDAVAGVMNIILRDDLEGFEFSARVGDTSQGGSESQRLQAAGGFGGERLHLSYAVEYLDRERLDVADREFMDSLKDSPAGAELPSFSIAAIDLLTNTFYDPGFDCDRFPELESAERTGVRPGVYCGRFDEGALRSTMRNARERLSGYLNLSYTLSDAMEFYGYTSVVRARDAYRNGIGGLIWGAAADTGGLFMDVDVLSNGPNPFLGLAQRWFQGSELPGGDDFSDIVVDEDTIDIAVGLRGGLFDTRFDYDLTISRAEYDFERRSALLREEAVNDFFQGPELGVTPGGIPIYDFDWERFTRPVSPDEVDLLWGQARNNATTSVDQASLVVTGDLFELPAGPVGIAAVAELASQDYRITPDARFQDDTGNGWWGAGSTPVPKSSRDRSAVGLEFALPLADTVVATLAGRYDDYDDITSVDGAGTYNFGLQWWPLENLMFRGSRATSFKAPDMHFVYGSSEFFVTFRDIYRCRRDLPQVPLDQCPIIVQTPANTVGNPNLQEEEGESLTAGLVWTPVRNLSIAFDYFEIELLNGVQFRSANDILEVEADCRLGETLAGTPVDINSAECRNTLPLITRLPADGSPTSETPVSASTQPINQSLYSVDGYDASVRYRRSTRAGEFGWTSEYSHVLHSEWVQFAGDEPFTRNHPSNFQFRSRMRSTLSWQRGRWAATVFQERLGSLPRIDGMGRNGTHITYNLFASYDLTENSQISLTAANVFDTEPPRDPSFTGWPFFPYRSYSPVGREVFLQFNLRQ